MLPSNAISSIPARSTDPSATQPLPLIKTLSISDNPIAKWSDIDALVTWLPNLQELGILFEPLKLCELLIIYGFERYLTNHISAGSSGASSRDFVISRLSQLRKLNGTDVSIEFFFFFFKLLHSMKSQVTERERFDAELFYLSWISKHEAGNEQDIEALHPRWKELRSSTLVIIVSHIR